MNGGYIWNKDIKKNTKSKSKSSRKGKGKHKQKQKTKNKKCVSLHNGKRNKTMKHRKNKQK
jgi:hypothetical protein